MDINKLPPILSKADLCCFFQVKRFRYLRKDIFTDALVEQELCMSASIFKKRQLFTVSESILIRKFLTELSPDRIKELKKYER